MKKKLSYRTSILKKIRVKAELIMVQILKYKKAYNQVYKF
jgi:hypothetical protein